MGLIDIYRLIHLNTAEYFLAACIIYKVFCYIQSTLWTLPKSNPIFLPTQLYYLHTLQAQFLLPLYFWTYGFPVEYSWLTRGYNLKENWFSLSQWASIVNHSSTGKWDFLSILPLHVEITHSMRRLSQPLWIHMCRCSVVFGRHCFLVVIQCHWLLTLSASSIQWSISLGMRASEIDVLF